MEQSLTKPVESRVPRGLSWAIGVALVSLISLLLVAFPRPLDPYISDVLAMDGNAERGHAIFQINCAGCHGLEGRGLVGPDLASVSNRKSRANLILQVTTGQTPPMPKFQPDPETMADLLSYLETL